MKLIKTLSTLFLILFLVTACSKQEKSSQKEEKKEIEVKKNIPFALKDINNNEIKIKVDGLEFKSNDLNKSITLLTFFTTWCPPCKAEIPHLVDIQKKYKNSLQVVGVLLEENIKKDRLKEFINEYNINYFVSISNKNFDFAKRVYALVQAPRNMPIPITVMLKDKKYFIHYLGAVPQEMIESDIKNALGE